MEKNLKISILYDFYGELLTPKQKEIIDNYYNKDLSLSEIAQNLGITRQGVFDNVKRAENTLIEMEDKIGLYIRFEQIQKSIKQISKNAEEIIIENKKNNNPNIENRANEIKKLVTYLKE